MKSYAYAIALGSNLGDRVVHLSQALSKIRSLGQVTRIAPMIENPPWLPPHAPQSWYSFFLNTALVLETELEPLALLDATQKIELELGRPTDHPNWSPRTIDIDLLFDLSGREFKHPRLLLPHPGWKKRNFVLAPLTHILPNHPEVLELYRNLPQKLPALMAIVNVTPDSFSQYKTETIDYDSIFQNLKNHFSKGTAYIDIGAESTRPGAQGLDADSEWQRLLPVLELVRELKTSHPFPQISIDTYHPSTAERALEYKVDVLNDVSGLTESRMQEAASHYKSTVVMHSLSIPADKNITWPEGTDAIATMRHWLTEKISQLSFLKAEQIIWDPGFGFGKTPDQTLSLIKNFETFQDFPVRSLVGHSRKSFMNTWTKKDFSERDVETLAISQILSNKGADILRVHNVDLHREFFKAAMAVQ
jgi:2-amino-4-hydroxy-6-hydroxymethyldihydropteridine diphosphokinase / dihydropteroate synthase